ncbi:hypothetical protein CK623_05840 [Vandammella animalimorsus]|uniref:DUF3322 and DUF2220 domain-containing protein n=1 Tax=Vandammella animalimorsus TaxID=2029117 RepID=A0A2A2ARK6_9BURK|nr:Wadjet anti-phage system protein JetD domain-containing protein [Vandammella animalimorsus]PAT40387.1 hypothetical protein CK623_05840 [Vandammella animalimorsus]
MKSPAQLAQALARRWQHARWREKQFLGAPQAWPLRLAIGLPDAATFQASGPELRQHVEAWQRLAASGPGQVLWRQHRYRGGAQPVAIPTHWALRRPSEYLAALRLPDVAASAEAACAAQTYERLMALLPAVDARWHRLLLRRPPLWQPLRDEQLIDILRVAQQLEPGCAAGKPLRALDVDGIDSKFFERHAPLLKALLDERFDGEASRQGLEALLGAAPQGEHWLLVLPLQPGLLPWPRLRLRTQELAAQPLPAERLLLVENERCLHQLLPLHGHPGAPATIAVLGAGLDLGWLAAPWLRTRQVAYWGDIDTWGLAMLAAARRHLPGLHALLMDRPTFDAHAHRAVPEPAPADSRSLHGLHPQEAALAQRLRQLPRGRLEQEFLPADTVAQALRDWWARP